jgi:hypothetical protein
LQIILKLNQPKGCVRTLMLNLTLLLAVIFSTGCASTLHMGSKRQPQRFDGGARPVFVTNPELKREYEILQASGIYHLSTEQEEARILTLHPIRQYGRCGNPLMLTGLTLGIVPGAVPAARAFVYDLKTDGVVETYEHPLPLYERVSIWEWLLRRDEQKPMAEALAWSSPRRPN